ncbi:LysR family transcriptional regulator [Pseudomonas typographi]|uniref:LysR family transcriptional regulator n=1 Tax=Pseudomonas typographi TaxID=2715964 RepID=A0ABR7YVQ7_9PSED|nr:LysR family transcriptional regulator [Pseudomonas typographi]MBD1549853.1 LysR family transcriptional regulator [Pseudomonas typographi]MBD1585234.1 LysR family transcriptional regulator [Pseudomonas typographi]MBD1597281.1 LysR family transcriptional regulator [Pseudomonas typographi]
MGNRPWNLEHISLFVEVAERRSFSAVARARRKAQSAISGAVAALETDLGVTLFDRSSGRHPQLTDAGSSLLEEARELLRQCERLDGRALALTRGHESRLRLAHDEAMPYQPVLDSLEELAARHPLLEVRLTSAAQGAVVAKLLAREVDLGLAFSHERMPQALERRAVGRVEMVTACPVGHPLAALQHVGYRELAQHRQLLITLPSSGYAGGEPASPQVWRADSFYAMAEWLIRGLGWAWLPRHVVQYPAYAGRMVELRSDCLPPALVVELLWRRDEPLGPVASWLAQRFAAHLEVIG